MILAGASPYILPLVSGVAVAIIGGSVTVYQVRTIGQRASARDDYTALWSEVRLRDADADRLRGEINALYDTIKRVRDENIKLEAELSEARYQVLQLTRQVSERRTRRDGNDVDN